VLSLRLLPDAPCSALAHGASPFQRAVTGCEDRSAAVFVGVIAGPRAAKRPDRLLGDIYPVHPWRIRTIRHISFAAATFVSTSSVKNERSSGERGSATVRANV
jgi:hypothetical protein